MKHRVLETRGRKRTFNGNPEAVQQIVVKHMRLQVSEGGVKRVIVYPLGRDIKTDIDKAKNCATLVNESGPRAYVSACVRVSGCVCVSGFGSGSASGSGASQSTALAAVTTRLGETVRPGSVCLV